MATHQVRRKDDKPVFSDTFGLVGSRGSPKPVMTSMSKKYPTLTWKGYRVFVGGWEVYYGWWGLYHGYINHNGRIEYVSSLWEFYSLLCKITMFDR